MNVQYKYLRFYFTYILASLEWEDNLIKWQPLDATLGETLDLLRIQ